MGEEKPIKITLGRGQKGGVFDVIKTLISKGVRIQCVYTRGMK